MRNHPAQQSISKYIRLDGVNELTGSFASFLHAVLFAIVANSTAIFVGRWERVDGRFHDLQ
jgi:hypothetical protein